jgi:hypothetical protein
LAIGPTLNTVLFNEFLKGSFACAHLIGHHWVGLCYARCRPFGMLFYVRKKKAHSFRCSWVPAPGNAVILSAGGSGIRKQGVYVFSFWSKTMGR